MKKYFIISITILILIVFISIFFANFFRRKEANISKLNSSIEKIEINNINVVTDSIEISMHAANEEAENDLKAENELTKENNNIDMTNVQSNKNETITITKSASTTKQNTTKKSNNKTNNNTISSNGDNNVKTSNKSHVHSTTGNCGKWFSSFDEFVEYFNSETKRWDNLYDNGMITWDNYIENCPVRLSKCS